MFNFLLFFIDLIKIIFIKLLVLWIIRILTWVIITLTTLIFIHVVLFLFVIFIYKFPFSVNNFTFFYFSLYALLYWFSIILKVQFYKIFLFHCFLLSIPAGFFKREQKKRTGNDVLNFCWLIPVQDSGQLGDTKHWP